MRPKKPTPLEQRAQAYREFRQFATHELAESVIRYGFQNLENSLERILHVYRQLLKDYPI